MQAWLEAARALKWWNKNAHREGGQPGAEEPEQEEGAPAAARRYPWEAYRTQRMVTLVGVSFCSRCVAAPLARQRGEPCPGRRQPKEWAAGLGNKIAQTKPWLGLPTQAIEDPKAAMAMWRGSGC